jgi:hypothetical protein
MSIWPKLSHHQHTGKLRPHHETSYGLLAAVIAVVGMLLATVSWSGTEAATTGSGTYNVYAVVPAPRPTTAPVITSPANGQSFSTNPVTVSGTCPDKTFIKVFSNGVLVGSVVCGQNKQFSLIVDLVIGQNSLTAVAFNINDESGPTSNTVNLTLTTPLGGLGFSTELLLQTTTYFRGAPPGTELEWPITLVGGVSPYAVSIDWGDGKQDLLTRTAPGPFVLKHTYAKPGGYLGAYPLIIRATDSSSHSAYLQVTSIVNAPGGTNTKVGGSVVPTGLTIAWPIWALSALVVISFFVGEWREKRNVAKRLEALA